MRRRLTLLIAGLVAGVVVVAGAALAADAPPEIAVTIDKDQFQPSEIKVKANTPFVLVVTNKNAKAAEFESKDLRVEKVVPARKTVTVRIRAMSGDVQRQIDAAQATHRMWIIGVIAFTGVFREGAETVLFLWGLLTQATSTSGWASALGAVLGLLTAASFGWAIFRGGRHVSLHGC